MHLGTFREIKNYRDAHIGKVSLNPAKLNHLHDQIMKMVVHTSIKQITDKYGPPPSPFSFFVMGSAGRYEQAVWSDQDHGIIYHIPSENNKNYFLLLGKEISSGLHEVGYPYCDGGVMASHSLWCKSFPEWQRQLGDWMQEASWESIRHLLIFIDGRALYGNKKLVEMLKTTVYHSIEKKHLLPRIVHNTMHVKKGISVFGQLLVETHGQYTGSLNIKDIAFFPYVNAVRLLAIKEKLKETSTLARLSKLQIENRELYKHLFLKLLHDRLTFGNHSDYLSGHYVSISSLTKEQRNEIKNIIKNATSLFYSICKLVRKED